MNFYSLNWSARTEVYCFLNLKDLYRLGCCNRKSFVVFLRERCILKSALTESTTSHFLGKGRRRETVSLTSYPRSGNSLLRRILENETNIITGSDSRTNRTLSESLLSCGFRGEGVVDDSVWIVKTHFPERLGYLKFAAHRVILLVRNPFDAIESYFHMAMTNSHNKTLTSEAMRSAPLLGIWERFVSSEARIWRDFHRFWLNLAKGYRGGGEQGQGGCEVISSFPAVPLLVVRYEDVVGCRREPVSDGLLRFLLSGHAPIGYSNKKSLDRHPLVLPASQPAAQEVGSFGTAGAGPGYTPRQGGIGKSLGRLTASQIDEILEITGDLLALFGYAIEPREVLSTTGSAVDPAAASRVVLRVADFDTAKLLDQYASMDVHLVPLGDSSGSARGADSAAPGGIGVGVVVNDDYQLRAKEDCFGRNVSALRRSLTSDDKYPFPTLP